MNRTPEYVMFLALIGGLLLSVEAGRWLARRAAARREVGSSESVFVAHQGALLGLLALLLAFSFSAASLRFIDRQEYVVREANAIGTADLRADVLAEPHQGVLRNVLRRYLELRTMLTSADPDPAPILAEMEKLHEQMWVAARDGTAANPTLALLVLPAINEVIDLHGSRKATAARHLPVAFLALLIGSAMLTMGTVGFSTRRRGMAWCLGFLVGATLWMTLDLDMPLRGVIRMDPTPLTSMKIRNP